VGSWCTASCPKSLLNIFALGVRTHGNANRPERRPVDGQGIPGEEPTRWLILELGLGRSAPQTGTAAARSTGFPQGAVRHLPAAKANLQASRMVRGRSGASHDSRYPCPDPSRKSRRKCDDRAISSVALGLVGGRASERRQGRRSAGGHGRCGQCRRPHRASYGDFDPRRVRDRRHMAHGVDDDRRGLMQHLRLGGAARGLFSAESTIVPGLDSLKLAWRAFVAGSVVPAVPAQSSPLSGLRHLGVRPTGDRRKQRERRSYRAAPLRSTAR